MKTRDYYDYFHGFCINLSSELFLVLNRNQKFSGIYYNIIVTQYQITKYLRIFKNSIKENITRTPLH